MMGKNSHKLAEKFHCESCDYSCSKKSDYNKHILTRKHQISTNLQQPSTEIVANKYVCKCGKSYKERTGLWYHSKNCDDQNPVQMNFDAKLLVGLFKQNQEFKDIIIEQNTKLAEQNTILYEQNNKIINVIEKNNNNITNISQVNSNNKTFNLQVFLNEDCKDAMNVSDFMNSLNLQVSDLECVGQLGFVEGISNIIIKRLNAMDITKRPVHCTDSKRETIYIKEDGVWTKDDDDNMKIRKLVRGVSSRNCRNATAYKAMYPEWKDPESKHSYIYDKIVLEAFGGTNNGKDDENENKIIRNILKHLTINKAAFS
jgi:hypothetical protein